MDDIAKEISMDPLEFRRKNLIEGYYEDAYLKPIAANTNGIFECLDKGSGLYSLGQKERGIQEPDRKYPKRRGHVPVFLQDRRVAYFAGNRRCKTCIESGRKHAASDWRNGNRPGADTVFSQMAAETLHMDVEDIHIVSTQDTDVTPFDTGAYASRQSFVTGTAVRECAELMYSKNPGLCQGASSQ